MTTQNKSAQSLFYGIVKGSSVYALSGIVMRLSAFILLPVSTRYLTPSDYGVLELMEQIGVVLAVLLGLSFSSALGYFFNQENDAEGRSRVLSTTMIGSALVGICAAALVAPFAGSIAGLMYGNQKYGVLLAVSLGAMPLSFMLEAGFTWLRVEDKPLAFLGASALRVVVTIGLTIILLAGFGLGIWGILFSSLGAITVVALVLAVAFFREHAPRFDRRLFVRMLSYSVPLGLSGVAMFIIHFGDRFLLPRFRPIEELGLYGLAYKMAMLLSVVYASFQSYWNAQIYRIVQREDAHRVFARIFTHVCLVLCFCSLGLVVFCRPALRVLTAPPFHRVADLVPLLVAAYFVRSIGDFFRCLFLVENRPGYENICNWIGALFCLAGYFLWIPRYGMWGAASATFVAFTVVMVVSLVWTARLWPYKVEARRVSILLGTTAVLMAIHYGIAAETLVAQFASGATLVLAMPAALWVLRFPTPGEKDILTKLIDKAATGLNFSR